MTKSRRRYVGVGLAATGALALVIAAVGLVAYFGGPFLAERSTNGRAGPETAAGPSAEPDRAPAVMSLHDEPRPLPELRFEDGDGRPVTIEDFRGKVVLLNIWATWCGPCRREMPTLDRLQARLGGPDFEVVALSIDRAGIGVVTEFYDEVGIEHLAKYIDASGKAALELEIMGLPTTLLIDREGREIGHHVGPAEWDTPEMVTFFRQRLSRESSALRPGAAGAWSGERAKRAKVASVRPRILRTIDLELAITGDTTPFAFNKATSS